ncbi:type V CRISPR-associated protein C2c8 [Chlorogloea sp. CCALA 695]|uniref:type V CRISPR-associated protein C2c8 n=1 Tax=Chlorogloea sp. CCALA 695 TaxID=2107693 RepID=UPI000D06CBE8|nr:type V CRISPR-associated protein C2c8 [Chlorogloea sp. CCALA 695]PSB27648.1 transposase [Chlorogloea sp. CCALA 695]
MRTVEFKLDLNQTQQAKVDDWLNVLRWVWNRGLHLLTEFDSFTSWDKVSKTWTPSCPIQWEYYRDDDGHLVPFTRLAQTKPYRMSCPISQAYRQPELESPNHFGLLYYFAQKNHEDKPWFCEVPAKVVAGTLKSLSDAWSEYKAGKHKRPRYKRYKDKLKTLVNNNSKSVKISGKQITLPKLGKVTVKTLDKRWDAKVPIATLKIVKEPSGYYLQLTGELPLKRFKPSNKAVGISLGYKDLFTTDSGKVVKPPAYYQKMEKNLQRLQRKLSRQQNICPISTYNPELAEHFLSCPINPHKGANKAKTQQKISQQHEKIRRARRAFNHKLSTKLVQEYGGIATAKSEVRKITRRPKPIVNKEGTGYDPNSAERKSQFNKQILANGLGQLTTLIEQKAVVNGREFIEIAPKEIPDEPRQRAERYSKRLRLPRAVHLSSFFGRYRAWSWESKPGESQRTLNQEASQEAALRDAGTTSKSSSANTNLTESSNFNGDRASRATSQSSLETRSELANPCKSESFKQLPKAKKHSSAPPTSEKQLGRKKRRSTRENDSS